VKAAIAAFVSTIDTGAEPWRAILRIREAPGAPPATQ
jgi:hypothetical protein